MYCQMDLQSLRTRHVPNPYDTHQRPELRRAVVCSATTPFHPEVAALCGSVVCLRTPARARRPGRS